MDIELYYREAGSGEPLIMLHGNGESGEYFINQIEHFQSRYRVIAPDTRGHGRSPRGEAPSPLRSLPMTFMISCRGSASPCGDPRLFGRREYRNEICDAAPRDGKGADPERAAISIPRA